MKKMLSICASFFLIQARACPTCVGQISPHTVPFFDKEFYQPGKSASPSQNNGAEYGKRELQKLINEHKGKK